MSSQTVNYCYRCGRRVSQEKITGDCWYCGTPYRRGVRDERRCPYCDEVVRDKAIKCYNCGEFLDDVDARKPRAKPKEHQPQFIIEKAIIQNAPESQGGPRLIAASEPIALEPPTSIKEISVTSETAVAEKTSLTGLVRRIEKPKGGKDDKALVPAGGDKASGKKARQDSPGASAAQPPAAISGSPPARVSAGQAEPSSIFRKTWDRVKETVSAGKRTRKKRAADDSIRFKPHDPYRTCSICSAEIFTTDNYCFSCGQKYAKADFRFIARATGRLDWSLYTMIVLCWVPPILYFVSADKPGRAMILTAAVAAPLLSILTWKLNAGSYNRNVAMALLVLSLLISAFPVLLVL